MMTANTIRDSAPEQTKYRKKPVENTTLKVGSNNTNPTQYKRYRIGVMIECNHLRR